MASDVVCFDEVGAGDGAAVADGQGPVLDCCNQGPPDAG
jgi:hypothetical protein